MAFVTTPPLPGYPQSPVERDRTHGFFFPGQIPDAIATHTASDIVLSASGRNASVFTGVGALDNTEVFFSAMRVALGDNSIWRGPKRAVGVGPREPHGPDPVPNDDLLDDTN
jgi:hypothetical protein